MKYFPPGESLTTENLLDALRRGQVFRVWIESMHYGVTSYRIFAEVVRKGEGLSSEIVRHEGRTSFDTESEALEVFLEALAGHKYTYSVHLVSGDGTLCNRPHRGGEFGPANTVGTIRALAEEPDKCLRCWVIWHAKNDNREV